MNQVKHLAVIMDGNRRWAKRRGIPTHLGHRAGKVALEKLVRACKKRDIEYVTVFGFSTENWKRSKIEVAALMNVMLEAIEEYANLLKEENIALKIIGDIEDFPTKLKSKLLQVVLDTKKNNSGVLTLALSYGGRNEIVRTINDMKTKTVSEKSFNDALDTAELPDPDLVIRTGGVMRLSGFLPWQTTYSELYFTKTLWPDFSSRNLDNALRAFTNRQRNFGK